ncbi:MAG: cobalt-precorrin 5A hydrolase [Candidatus Hydrothermarchaeales archaeon]
MRTAVFSVTDRGRMTAGKINDLLEADYYDFSAELIKKSFHEYDALVFVMALGIVVRTIASEIGDKRSDPLVVVVDEAGRHAISVLSGHRGANKLAKEIAEGLGGVPVVTTATDVQGKPCVEEIAAEMGLKLDYFSDVKGANAAIVNDRKVGIFVDPDLNSTKSFPESGVSFPLADSPDGYDTLLAVTNKDRYELEVPTAILRPKNLIVGLGAKRGVEGGNVMSAIRNSLKEANLSVDSVRALATADFKASEKGLVDVAEEMKVPLLTVKSDEIKENEDLFDTSEDVRAKVGVGAVCEPCAVLAGRGARLVQGKRRYSGVTVAIAEEKTWESSS